MTKYQKSNIKDQNYPVIPSDPERSRMGEGSLSPTNERKRFLHAFHLVGMTRFLILFLIFALCILHSEILAVSPTVIPKLSVTPIASPSASLIPASPSASQGGPTGSEDEKVQEVRQAIKDKLNQIKDKVEKKAYVGVIVEITDSTLTVNNFRGKQRVRIAESTIILDAKKKEIKAIDLAVDDKVIALGEIDPNDTLDAKRIVVVPKPTTVIAKRLTQFGTISTIDPKTSLITITGTKDVKITLKIDSKTILIRFNDAKTQLKLKDIKPDQKVIAIYPETAEGKVPVAIDIFLLP